MAKAKTKARIPEKSTAGNDKDGVLIMFAMALIVILAASYIIIQALGETDNPADSRQGNSSLVIDDNSKNEDLIQCLAKNGISSDAIYIYGKDCSYSQDNTPWVNDLISEGYSISMLEVSNTSAMLAAYNCLSGIASFEGTPEYVCLKTNATRLGAFSLKSEIVAFMNSCK